MVEFVFVSRGAVFSVFEARVDPITFAQLSGERFWVFSSSETFLAGESRDIRSRFRLDDPSHVPILFFSGLAVIYLVMMRLSKVVEFNFSALKEQDSRTGCLAPILSSHYLGTDPVQSAMQLLANQRDSCTGCLAPILPPWQNSMLANHQPLPGDSPRAICDAVASKSKR